jgi:hypothetical protein
MSMFYSNAMRGYGLGAKYGIMEGLQRYQHTTETPKMDESAMQGAIGIIIAVGGVLIALYIIAVVVGSISYAVTSGNIKLSPTWNTTITNIDSQAQATFNLANVLPIAIIGVGTVLREQVKPFVHIAIDPDDCDRSFQRSGRIDVLDCQSRRRTLNTVMTRGGISPASLSL